MDWKNIDISEKELEKQTEMYKKLAMDAASRSRTAVNAEISANTEINTDNDSNSILGNDVNISDFNINIENINVLPEEGKNTKDEEEIENKAETNEEQPDNSGENEAAKTVDEKKEELNTEKIIDAEDADAVFAEETDSSADVFLQSDEADDGLDEYIKAHNTDTSNFQEE